jgi:hypothetical protein
LGHDLESRTTINDVIAPEECQAFRQAPQWVCLGYQLKQTSSALKNVACALRSIYLTFSQWGVLALLDKINIHTLKVNNIFTVNMEMLHFQHFLSALFET